ncbi:TIGR03087 family PEP-CTERM/XrtA system glycosyltransferase [Kordiimonas sp.]|uniref:TIGR03087 family PEP-CTERM/XrtA system glycosyltransferase n=1 Tax=Kordiimonas sp. TaxID=1970157 RepID=UPI003A8EB7EC
MARILFLAHRIPYPPNKGDKIRSWHFLEHLLEHHDVHLGFYIDEPADAKHVAFLESKVKSLCFESVSKRAQKLMALRGLVDGRPLTLAAYPKTKLATYVRDLTSAGEIDLIFLFSGATMQLIEGVASDIPVIADLVDVDSAKWAAYSHVKPWPLSWLYRREAQVLSDYEREITAATDATLFVSEDEAAVFRKTLNASLSAKVRAVSNGVNLSHFDPQRFEAAKAEGGPLKVIFTGAMDYAPNVEAAEWFTRSIWPRVRAKYPNAEFLIAGGPKVPEVVVLERAEGVRVLGYVDDMAETIASADVVVAPLLTARGIQNKVLEGMAMAKPVVATPAAHEGIAATAGDHLLVAANEDEFARALDELLTSKDKRETVGNAARAFIEDHHSWASCLSILDKVIAEVMEARMK